MTDSDDKLLQRYRALPREEPPRALDDTILAASRRAVARPSASRRWAGPLSIAAVLVLAFGVTLEMQREEPGLAYKETAKPVPATAPVVPAAPTASTDPLASESARVAEKPAAVEMRRTSPPPRQLPPAKKEAAPLAKEADRPPDAFATLPPQAQSMPAAPQFAPMEKARDANVAPLPAASPPASAAMAAPRAKAMANPLGAKAEMADAAQAPVRTLAEPMEPERELERIAKLRDEGRNAEADKAIEEFKRKFPAFRIPDAMWSRVKPR